MRGGYPRRGAAEQQDEAGCGFGEGQLIEARERPRNHGQRFPAGGRGALGAAAAAQGQLLPGGAEAGQHPARVPRGDLHLRGGARGLRERRENETVLGGVRAGEQSVRGAAVGGGRPPLALPDRAAGAGGADRRRGGRHRVALPLPQAQAAQPQPGTLAPRPGPGGGLHGGPLGQGVPPRRPSRTQHPQHPGVRGLRAGVGESRRRRPAAIVRGGGGPRRRPHRDGASAAVRGHRQHQLHQWQRCQVRRSLTPETVPSCCGFTHTHT